MDCNEFLARYSEYDDSRIAAGEAERFRAHMERCPACTRYDRVLRKGRMVARQLRIESSDDFLGRLDQRLWRETHRVRRSGLHRPAQVAAALAALTVLLAASAAVGLFEVQSVVSGPAPPDGAGAGVPIVAAPGMASGDARARVRTTGLPPLGGAPLREWSAERVAPAPTTSYSPLVVGPPAYRRAAGPSNPVHSLD